VTRLLYLIKCLNAWNLIFFRTGKVAYFSTGATYSSS
jgi:hypothetical protein